MKLGSSGRRTYETRSAAAGQAASQPQARKRRRAQRTQRFAQQWEVVADTLSGGLGAVAGWLRWPHIRWPEGKLHLELPGFSGFHLAKLLSLALLVGVVTLFIWFSDNDSFFVYQENVNFGGTTFLETPELYSLTDVEAWSILWLEPSLIRQQVLKHPYVADASVSIHWPAQVRVAIVEVTPIAIWATEGGDYWVLADGRALPVRSGGITPTLRLVDPQREARVPGRSDRISSELLAAALHLQEKLSLNEFWYSSSIGLNFPLPETKTWVYWGDGSEFEAKQLALNAAKTEIQSNPNEARTLSLIAPNRPYFREYPAQR
ncbi:MAG: hypothetical protein DWI57_17360 [Chloroflexi bacterium]|nr:MAG: hypothetical protein DWI57_17360 [Chloroflexota bacterium]